MPERSESHDEAFARGKVAGEVDQRLQGHDVHFDKINGSLEKVAANMAALNMQVQGNLAQVQGNLAQVSMQVQRLTDKLNANEVTTVATALALKNADEVRREEADRGWSPLARWSTAVGILVALLSVVVVVVRTMG